MIRPVVAVLDTATQLYGQPFYVPAIGAAMRSFTDEVNRQAGDNQLNKHPDDFHLYHLADFDDEQGTFTTPPEGPRLLARGKDVQTA